jgi:hypothetical protein
VLFKEGYLFSKVWDITESKNFEFEVPFTAATQMLALSHPQYSNLTELNFSLSGATMFALDPRFHNGFVNLTVLNQLLGPNAAGVKIICSCSIEDLEFAEPCCPGTSVNTSIGSTSKPMVEAQAYLSLSHNYQTTSGVPSDHKPFDAEIYNGEKVLSLRSLLHRSCDYTLLSAPATNVGGTGITGCVIYNRYTIPREPLSPGEHTYGTSSSRVIDIGQNFTNNLATAVIGATANGYSYVAMSPFCFLKGMFAGYRGSMRWKIVSDLGPDTHHLQTSNPNIAGLYSLTVSRSRDYTGSTTWTSMRSTGASASRVQYDSIAKPDKRGQMALRGADYNSSVCSSTISVDVPMYSRYKFLPTNDTLRSFNRSGPPSASLGGISGDGIYELSTDSIDIDCRFNNPASRAGVSKLTSCPTLRVFTSCGTDFSFVGFINTPTIYVTTTLPAPAD